MKNYVFFEEAGKNMFGERFGRAIVYKTEINMEGNFVVIFEKGIIPGEDDHRDNSLATKETLVVYAIYAFAQRYNTVYVRFNAYGESLKVTEDFTVLKIREAIHKIQISYLKKLDIF